jgi:hypothetical protein
MAIFKFTVFTHISSEIQTLVTPASEIHNGGGATHRTSETTGGGSSSWVQSQRQGGSVRSMGAGPVRRRAAEQRQWGWEPVQLRPAQGRAWDGSAGASTRAREDDSRTRIGGRKRAVPGPAHGHARVAPRLAQGHYEDGTIGCGWRRWAAVVVGGHGALWHVWCMSKWEARCDWAHTCRSSLTNLWGLSWAVVD